MDKKTNGRVFIAVYLYWKLFIKCLWKYAFSNVRPLLKKNHTQRLNRIYEKSTDTFTP